MCPFPLNNPSFLLVPVGLESGSPPCRRGHGGLVGNPFGFHGFPAESRAARTKNLGGCPVLRHAAAERDNSAGVRLAARFCHARRRTWQPQRLDQRGVLARQRTRSRSKHGGSAAADTECRKPDFAGSRTSL